LYNRGVLLAINSRNNPEDALKVIREHPNMILKEKNFAASRMNWADKSDNLRELAKELNIGLDSMVFLDDDPTNRALVRSMLPEVETPELPSDPSEYASFLNSLPYFPAEAITDEDKMRGNLYVTERLRREEERQHQSKEDFLKSLNLKLAISENDTSAVTRLSQMTEKTNQFNLDKNPLSEEKIASYMQDPKYRVLHGKLVDKFGDYGIILFGLVEDRGHTWHIPSMLMSCRAFGRGVEHAFLSLIAEKAKAAGAQEITINFSESEKNAPAKEFADALFPDRKMAISSAPQAPSWIQLSI
jgi:FkbH-like protein